MNLSSFRATIGYRYADADVLNSGLGVFHENVEVAVVIKDARIQQFKFRLLFSAAAVLFYQAQVWILRLRVPVEILHIKKPRRGIPVEGILLHVLARVSLIATQPTQPLPQHRN